MAGIVARGRLCFPRRSEATVVVARRSGQGLVCVRLCSNRRGFCLYRGAACVGTSEEERAFSSELCPSKNRLFLLAGSSVSSGRPIGLFFV